MEAEACVFDKYWTLNLQDFSYFLKRKRGTLTASAALRHLSAEISSIVPWISTRSMALLWRSTMPPRIASTSINLFLFPVIKFSCLGAILRMDADDGG